MDDLQNLTWRERQILDILWARGTASVEDVRAELPDPPSYSATRTLLGRMETKGLVEHQARDLKYVYSPIVPRDRARQSAAARLVSVFCKGSVAEAVSGLVGSADSLSDEELRRMERALREARARRSESSS